MIGIVILNYNSFADTINLVEELQLQSVSEQFEIIVVDNESPNDSIKMLKPLEEQFKNVTVIETGSNLGYAKGNNFGLNYLNDHINPNYVAILNNDIILPLDCFEKLIGKYKILDSPGIIAPKQLDIKENEVLPYPLNTFLTDCLSLFFVTKLFYKHRALKYKDTSGKGAMKVDVIPGSFMFSSFNVFKSMGFFYPNTFLFTEERFIAVKAKQMKLNNYVMLEETYIHAHSKTIDTAFNKIGKFKLLYEGWLEFTRVCRKNGKFKAAILSVLMKLSLLEMRVVFSLKQLFKKK